MAGLLDLTDTIYHKSINKSIQQGIGLAFALSILLLLIMGIMADQWIFMPLITSSIGGAVGGIAFHFIVQRWNLNPWQKLLMTVIGLLIYFTIFWISLVFGFAITGHWD